MNIIDLFAGAGGFSTGFERAGFESKLAVEIDVWASQTYKFNHPNTVVYTKNIKEIYDLNSLYSEKIDGIIGGPPCQGFSLSGKRDRKDPRNSLFVEFVRFVNHYKPLFFVMENVPGLLSMKTDKKEKVINIIQEEFKKIGYKSTYKILNAANYGVPQKRNRVFIIGVPVTNDINIDLLYPEPIMLENDFITVEQAISDLPKINSGESFEGKKYTKKYTNDYQKYMREDSFFVYNHTAMRHTKRLISRFEIIKQGESLKNVPAEHMQRKRGEVDKISGKVYSQNNMRVIGRLPAPTIAASFQSNYIHPTLHRNFTAREAARLQSFPDTYIFQGKRTTMSWEKHLSQYQQIGNAVPPLLAYSIARNIRNILFDISNI